MDSYVFPELDRGRNGDTLEARFNAFKIPESNFLVFEATVRTCREGCQPAYCPAGAGRSEPSFGRRKRDTNGTLIESENNGTRIEDGKNETDVSETTVTFPDASNLGNNIDSVEKDEEKETPEYVREMIEVSQNFQFFIVGGFILLLFLNSVTV